MKKFIVEGSFVTSFSTLITAENQEEAEKIADELTADDIQNYDEDDYSDIKIQSVMEDKSEESDE